MGRHALLIATWRYTSTELSELRTPAEDVTQLAQLLGDSEIGDFELAPVLRNEPRYVLEEAIEEFLVARQPDDTVLLYMSCHGLKDEPGRLYFATTNTVHRRLESTAVSARFVHEQIERCRAQQIVVVLDCCYSGQYVRDAALSQQVQGRDSYLITATDHLEYALENGEFRSRGGPAQPSLFTKALIDGLGRGVADIDQDGRVTAGELFEHAKREAAGQKPQAFGSPGGDQIQVAKAYGHGMRHAVGSPFSHTKLGLQAVLSELGTTDDRGLHDPTWEGNGRLIVPLGKVYEPGKGWEGKWCPVLTGGTGNVAIVGGHYKGKTSALSALGCALALTHTPREVQLYCVRDNREGLKQLAPLPHVGMVAARTEASEVEQLVGGAADLVERRKGLWDELDVRSLRALRAIDDPATQALDPYGEVFVLIDNWPLFEQTYPELTQRVLMIAREGLRHAVHLAISVGSWGDIRDELLPHFGTWIELALDSPRGSRVGADLAAKVPSVGAGYGLLHDHRYVHVVAPQLDGSSGIDDVDEWVGLDRLVREIARAWPGPGTPALHADVPAPEDEPDEEPPAPVQRDLPSLLGIGDPASFDVDAAWAPRAEQDKLAIPIGVDDDGQPVWLDIKESARNGMGPHGLLVGATGSGKSELLRTIVLGLAATTPSEALNFVLIDYKGGATFLGLADLPHVSTVVTNLVDESVLVNRMFDALAGEMVRRQEVLQKSGNFPSHKEYERARANGVELPPLPSLLIVVDEFSELLNAKPEFIELFVQIGRIGRSLGVHMLLSSQRLEEGKLRGLDTFLSYRLGLRTFSASESRTVLGTPDAYELPPSPGHGYLKIGTNQLIRFLASYVSGPYDEQAQPGETGPSVLDTIVGRLRGKGIPAHEVWLPPLDEPATLDQLLPPLVTSERFGLHADWERRGRLTVPVGLIDKPHEQRRDAYVLDLSGAGGNVSIAGAPRSGKSTLLRGLIASLALTHSPAEVGFYCLDFGGRTLSSLFGLPHVGGIATRNDTEAIHRTVAEVSLLMAQREVAFADQRVDSMTTYRRLRGQGELEPDRFPTDVFLVIDGWGTVRSEYEAVESAVNLLATRGLGFGIHVVATCVKWSELRMSIRDLFSTKLELRLGDPMDSEIDRRVSAEIPLDRPGRGLTPQKLHFLGALPRIDGVTSDDDLSDGVTAMCQAVAEQWAGEPAAPVRMLPGQLAVETLPGPDENPQHLLPIGIDEERLEPVCLDLAAESHLFVTGDHECGKSNLLRLIAQGIVERYSPKEARVLVIDYRRSLLETLAGKEHLLGYAASSEQAKSLITDAAAAIRKRLPGPNVTPDQLRKRTWWGGSDLYIIVDDYELVATQAGNPLTPLVDLVSQARDVGLHLIVARGFSGVARATYDQIVMRMRELGDPALIMSGNREEGTIWGVRAEPLPPGRGTLVSRRLGTKLIQTAVVPNPYEEAET